MKLLDGLFTGLLDEMGLKQERWWLTLGRKLISSVIRAQAVEVVEQYKYLGTIVDDR